MFSNTFSLVFSILFLVSHAATIDLSNCDKFVKRGDGLVCYKGYQTSNDFEASRTFCQAESAEMATINSEAENDVVKEIMSDRLFDTAWIGMKQTLTPWSWNDGTELSNQGCYHTSFSDSFFTLNNTFTDNSPEKCVHYCRTSGNKYAGLTASNQCLCAATFQTSTHTDASCYSKCPLDSLLNCGGDNSSKVHVVDGGYSSWIKGRPSNEASAGFTCSILMVEALNPLSLWMDVKCADKFKTICEIELKQDFSTCDTSMEGIKELSYTKSSKQIKKCLYVTKTSMDFFSATKMCASLNGKVINVQDEEMNKAVVALFSAGMDFWTGAKMFNQKWNDDSKVLFSKWSQLSFERKSSCGTVNSGGANTLSQNNWALKDCSQKNHVICETSNSTYKTKPTFFQTAAPTTTNAPITKQINLIPSTTLPTINITIPILEEKTSNTVKYAALGGALGGGLLLILIAIIVVACIAKRKHRLPAVKNDLESKKSVFVEPTYFFGAQVENETAKKNFDDNRSTDSGNDCNSNEDCSGSGY